MLRKMFSVRNLSNKSTLLLTVFSLGFLLLPIVVIVGSSFGTTSYLSFPPQGFTLKWYHEVFSLTEFIDPLKMSIQLGLIAATIATILGLSVSFAVVRYNFRGKNMLNNVFLSPLIIPLIVTAQALYLFFSALGMRTHFTNLMIAHTIVTIPYAIRTITASLQVFDITLEEAAMSLGANRLETFLKVTLPQIRPGVVAGWLFAFAMSFDEFVVASFLCGPGRITFPVQLFNYIRWSINPVMGAVSTFLILFTLFLAFALDRVVGLDTILGTRGK